MKKLLIIFLTLLLVFPLISALNVSVERLSEGEVLINNLSGSVIFDLMITNMGNANTLEFYNLVGFSMTPKRVSFGEWETKNVLLEIKPIGDFTHTGFYSFDYFIRGKDFTEVKQKLLFKSVNLESVFEVGSGELNLEENSIEIYVKNNVNFDFEKVEGKFSSPFFDIEETFSIGPSEKKIFTVEFNQEEFKELMAGFYTFNAELSVEGKKSELEGVIKFVEKDLLKTSKKDYGFIINTQVIEKINEGNILVNSETVVKKNMVSRLFTTFSPNPDNVDREGTIVYYTWAKQINPGESLEITIKTNWLFPFIIIMLIIIIIFLVTQYTKTHVVIRKKVSFVKAKGGEFALKVSIFVQAKNYVERVSIIDKLPPLVKVYEKFGKEEPSKVNTANRRIEWNYEKLEAGETRLLTYIIYSKVGIVGRFALPFTTAIYEKNGKIQEAESNRAFFVAEQTGKDPKEE